MHIHKHLQNDAKSTLQFYQNQLAWRICQVTVPQAPSVVFSILSIVSEYFLWNSFIQSQVFFT